MNTEWGMWPFRNNGVPRDSCVFVNLKWWQAVTAYLLYSSNYINSHHITAEKHSFSIWSHSLSTLAKVWEQKMTGFHWESCCYNNTLSCAIASGTRTHHPIINCWHQLWFSINTIPLTLLITFFWISL